MSEKHPDASPFSPRHAILDKIVQALLYNTDAYELLMGRVWETWTDEQRKEIADRAYTLALARLDVVVPHSIRTLGAGSAKGQINLFADHVKASIRRAFDDRKVEGSIRELVTSHLDETLSSLRETVTKTAGDRAREILVQVADRIDAQTARSLIRDALLGEKGRG